MLIAFIVSRRPQLLKNIRKVRDILCQCRIINSCSWVWHKDTLGWLLQSYKTWHVSITHAGTCTFVFLLSHRKDYTLSQFENPQAPPLLFTTLWMSRRLILTIHHHMTWAFLLHSSWYYFTSAEPISYKAGPEKPNLAKATLPYIRHGACCCELSPVKPPFTLHQSRETSILTQYSFWVTQTILSVQQCFCNVLHGLVSVFFSD